MVLLTCKDLSVPVASTILWHTLWSRTVREHREWKKLVTDIVSAHLFYQTSRSIVRRIIQMMMTQPCREEKRPQETSVPSFVYSGHCFDWDTIDERFARITVASRPRSRATDVPFQDYSRIRPGELLLVVMEDRRFRLLESLSCPQIIHQTMIRARVKGWRSSSSLSVYPHAFSSSQLRSSVV